MVTIKKLIILFVLFILISTVVIAQFISKPVTSSTRPIFRPKVLNLDTARDLTYKGINYWDWSGSDVANGDLNNDGYLDLVIGAFAADTGTNGQYRDYNGQVYVMYGSFANVRQELEIYAEADFTINGTAPGGNFGTSIATGDLNDDGITDLVVSAYTADFDNFTIVDGGATYVIYGPLPNVISTDKIDNLANLIFRGREHTLSGFGVDVGDLNNDGVDDLIIGAGYAHPAGETYVIYGPLQNGFGVELDIDTNTNLIFMGIDNGDAAGASVAHGDINNDGVADLVIGNHAGDPNGRFNAGETYVIYGPLLPKRVNQRLDISANVNLIFNGITSSDESGRGVATGDINNDGKTDLIIGASQATAHTSKGETYVIYGPFYNGLNQQFEILGVVDRIYKGINTGDRSGFGVDSGDLDNDKKDDLIIGAPTADPSGKINAGETYVVFARRPSP